MDAQLAENLELCRKSPTVRDPVGGRAVVSSRRKGMGRNPPRAGAIACSA